MMLWEEIWGIDSGRKNLKARFCSCPSRLCSSSPSEADFATSYSTVHLRSNSALTVSGHKNSCFGVQWVSSSPDARHEGMYIHREKSKIGYFN